MNLRTIEVDVPSHWSDEELAERLQRLRHPETAAEQRAKEAARVAVESTLVAELAARARKQEERVRVLEEAVALLVTRSEAEDIRKDLAKTDEYVDAIEEALRDEITARELGEKSLTQAIEARASELGAEFRKGLRSVRASLGVWARRWAELTTEGRA